MVRKTQATLSLIAILGLGFGLWSGLARGGEWYKPFRALAQPVEAAHREKPHTGRDPSIEQLADEIDWLEHHIDAYGSVVAKTPDVWGETRLMRHRCEYERQMAAMLNQFEVKISGSLARSDQAFLGMAMALQAAASGTSLELPEKSFNVVSTQLSNFTAGNDTVVRTAPFGATTSVNGFSFSGNAISLEPTTQLNQLSRYLDHLHELRRINEGDDTSDSPGYSLNLVRIPVSVLPGKKTREGYGAEITLIATPVLGPELLPTTFRNLVINDLVDLISPIVTQVLNDPEVLDADAKARSDVKAHAVESDSQSQFAAEAKAVKQAREKAIGEAAANRSYSTRFSVQSVRSRRARLPLAPSQLATVLGQENLGLISTEADSRLKTHPVNAVAIHYMDVREYVNAELQAAYDFLAAPANADLWYDGSLPELGACVTEQKEAVAEWRKCFLDKLCAGMAKGKDANSKVAVASVLSWAILVESALLNEQLKRDMRELASAKGTGCVAPDGVEFFGPCPSEEARNAFNEYVRCRWPIRVFALDPVTDEQNVADAFSRRRELQVAVALAFASGRLSAQGLMRFNRRLEWDMATIDLNRTVVGFSHGEDTFGWRFMPRFQTPPVKGNLATFWETTFGGPTRDQDIEKRQLEPGMRECVAIVVMPSFVPYITFDTRTNWFKLTNPKCTEISMQETMRLSRSVKAMQCSAAACAGCAHLYRDGEVQRLLRRVAQLDRELPLQTLPVQVPYENTLGGFAMFNHGVTDLGPELIGWYGAPGIDPAGPTNLFLIGDRFSVLDTRLIAGGRSTEFHLISRQVMEATIPGGVQVLASGDDLVVDVHLATPYGVSSHLLVPVAPKAASTEAGFAWMAPRQVQLGYAKGDDKKVTMQEYTSLPCPRLSISVPRRSGIATATKVRIFLFDKEGSVYLDSVEQDFSFNPQENSLYVSGSGVSTLLTSVKTKIKSYLDYKIGRNELSSPVDVVAIAELAPTGIAPIPVGCNLSIVVQEEGK